MKRHVGITILLVCLSRATPLWALDGYQAFNENGRSLLEILPVGVYSGVFEAPGYFEGLPCLVSVEIVDRGSSILRVRVDFERKSNPRTSWMINDFTLEENAPGCKAFVASIPYRSPYFNRQYTNRFGASVARDGGFVVSGKQAKQEYRCVNLRPSAPQTVPQP